MSFAPNWKGNGLPQPPMGTPKIVLPPPPAARPNGMRQTGNSSPRPGDGPNMISMAPVTGSPGLPPPNPTPPAIAAPTLPNSTPNPNPFGMGNTSPSPSHLPIPRTIVSPTPNEGGANEAVVHQGYLLKKKKTNTGWKKSYFTITKDNIKYTKKNGKNVNVPCKDITVIEELPGTFFKIYTNSCLLDLSVIKADEKPEWINRVKSVATSARTQTQSKQLSPTLQPSAKSKKLLNFSFSLSQKKVCELEQLKSFEQQIRSFNPGLRGKNIEDLTHIVLQAEAVSLAALQLVRNANRALMSLGIPMSNLPGKSKDSLFANPGDKVMVDSNRNTSLTPNSPSIDNDDDIFKLMEDQAGSLNALSLNNNTDCINDINDFANETHFMDNLPDIIDNSPMAPGVLPDPAARPPLQNNRPTGRPPINRVHSITLRPIRTKEQITYEDSLYI